MEFTTSAQVETGQLTGRTRPGLSSSGQPLQFLWKSNQLPPEKLSPFFSQFKCACVFQRPTPCSYLLRLMVLYALTGDLAAKRIWRGLNHISAFCQLPYEFAQDRLRQPLTTLAVTDRPDWQLVA